MIKVKFIKSPTGKPYELAYSIGDVAEFEKSVADVLIGDGLAVPVSDDIERADAKPVKNAEKRQA